MKKRLIFGILILIHSFVFAEMFPSFPMTIYGEIKIGDSPLEEGTINVYNSLNQELTTYDITESGKYGSDNVSKLPLLLNEFEGNLIFEVVYSGETYIVDSINDSYKKDTCPDGSSITFVSDNCRYDISLKIENDGGDINTGGTNTGDIDINTGSAYTGDINTGSIYTGDINTGDVEPEINTGDSDNHINHGGSSHKDNNSEGEHNSADISDTQPINDDSSDNQLPNDDEDIQENGFTKEFNDAYQFSYKNGITTRENIEDANIKGPLTRIDAAKMLAQYAMNVLGKKPDISKGSLKYKDVTNQLNEQYDNAIILVYQLGIMGVNVNGYFRPNDIITRAEFGTALSRILYGTENGTDVYYTTHLNKLKQEGIIKNSNPNLKEIKGYVMLMLMRAATDKK